ncbi:hypothetical protein [Aureimonas endophytica]|nr:hypothetical protein [Aureimonas endophytica]
MSLDDAREAILPSRLHCYLDLDPRAVRGADRVLVVRERRVVTVLAAETRVLNQPEAA